MLIVIYAIYYLKLSVRIG